MTTRILALLALALVGCDDSNGITEPPGGGRVDAGPSSLDAGLDDGGKPKDCFDPPFTTHFQIINACTNADKIDRKPTSTKIFPDGGVPKP